VIREIRSKGMMFGIQLSRPGRGLVEAALARGLLINCTQENVLRLLPPYIIGESEMVQTIRILDEIIA
jgi:acetylornithine/succinyldiaminopimelate/putrescine aminotransferase